MQFSSMWTLHKLRLREGGIESQRRGDSSTPSPQPMWEEFSEEELVKFPALRRRNFWCVQRHQATALHYDLRLQVDGGTESWAIPKGLLGLKQVEEPQHLAVRTTIHPIDYTIHEGAEDRMLRSGVRCGTLLWDVGTYAILDYGDDGYDSQDSRDMKRDDLPESLPGAYEESRLRDALQRIERGDKKSIHLVLKDGVKLRDHHYILVALPRKTKGARTISEWLLRLPRGVAAYDWGAGGEEGIESGLSVKTGRTFREVCHSKPSNGAAWQTELSMFSFGAVKEGMT